MKKGISIRYNPRTKQYEAHDLSGNIVSYFPDYLTAMQWFKGVLASSNPPHLHLVKAENSK